MPAHTTSDPWGGCPPVCRDNIQNLREWKVQHEEQVKHLAKEIDHLGDKVCDLAKDVSAVKLKLATWAGGGGVIGGVIVSLAQHLIQHVKP